MAVKSAMLTISGVMSRGCSDLVLVLVLTTLKFQNIRSRIPLLILSAKLSSTDGPAVAGRAVRTNRAPTAREKRLRTGLNMKAPKEGPTDINQEKSRPASALSGFGQHPRNAGAPNRTAITWQRDGGQRSRYQPDPGPSGRRWMAQEQQPRSDWKS